VLEGDGGLLPRLSTLATLIELRKEDYRSDLTFLSPEGCIYRVPADHQGSCEE
jgi:hypothetical protein